ncbi:MAG TPA: CusA/CzcA family heavy metal efflux RND transporter [Verrucomicrobiae bacterium]|nr:CusA/CzcA family heavy metal efflux RND transporter [Verrucomicrobiae bacterium]
MIKRIVGFALHQPLFVVLMVILFIGGGWAAFHSLPIEAFPDVSDIQVNVITLYPGRAPEEVEKQVTMPIETVLNGLPHMVRMFSHTQFGLSFIMLTFDDHTTDNIARQQALERLATADLPQGIQPQLAPLSTAIGEIFRYTVQGAGYSTRELRTLEDWVVERSLRGVPGVADVVPYGGLVKTYEVNPNLARMRYYGLSLQTLYTALGRGNANVGGSKVTQGSQQYLIRGVGLLRGPEDIKKIVLGAHDGAPIFVKDVAEVTLGHVPVEGIMGQDDQDDVVSGIVVMRKGENPSEVLTALKARIELLNNSILPKGVKLVSYYDRTWLIKTTLHTVFKNLAEGAILVTFVLLLFLGNLRAAAIVALMIPLSLLATFIGLSWRGIPANLLSLGAMDFGIIVDGAVIVVENVFRRLGELKDPHDKRRFATVIEQATVEVGRPTFFSMLIIIAAHIPIFTLQRHEGRIFAPMAWTVTSALVGSLVFSLTLVPLLCLFLLRKNIPHGENALVRLIKKPYVSSLRWALQHPVIVIVTAVSGFAVSLALASKLGTEFLPELNEGTIWVNANMPPGISVEQARVYCRRMREILRKTPEVRSVISKAGRPEDGTDPKPINMAEIFVDLKPPSEWKRGLTKEQVIEEMDRNLDALPGIETSFSQPIRDNVLESISQIDGQVVLKVFGDDSAKLRAKAQELLNAIADVPGVQTAAIDRAGEVPQAIIDIDRERAARYGLNIGDVEDIIEIGLAGKGATELWEGEKHFSVVVRLPEAERSLANLKKVLVDTPDGLHIPLEQVADFREFGGSMNISRENGTRLSAISVFIKGRDMGSVVADMQQRVRQVSLPQGYLLTWSGEFENQQRAMRRLAIIVPISTFLIFVLLFDAFKSVKSALLILINVPLGLIGGILALLLTGIPLSVSAAIGFIALFGQAVLNGVVMVSYFNQLQDEGVAPYEAVLQGASTRLRTVLMTALLAMLGLLPMALSHGIGSETQRPLAIVIIGGLVSATFLTLMVLPTLYLVIERRVGAKPGLGAGP